MSTDKPKRRNSDTIKFKTGATAIGVVVITIFALFTGLNNIPWAPKGDVAENSLNIKSLYSLKEQDNKWYLELSTDFATMKANQVHIKENQVELKADIREIKNLITSRRP